MVTFEDSIDFGDWQEPDPFDDGSFHPPTPEEQAQMLEALSIAQAIAFLRDRGIHVDAHEVQS